MKKPATVVGRDWGSIIYYYCELFWLRIARTALAINLCQTVPEKIKQLPIVLRQSIINGQINCEVIFFAKDNIGSLIANIIFGEKDDLTIYLTIDDALAQNYRELFDFFWNSLA